MILLPERQTLSDWLRIASWRLADSAKERIRIEIEAHYNQAVEAHRGNGLSESAAQATALVELGDPEAAAKRFRKRHLTEWEAEKLRKSDKEARSVLGLLFCYLFFPVFIVIALHWKILSQVHHPFALFCPPVCLFNCSSNDLLCDGKVQQGKIKFPSALDSVLGSFLASHIYILLPAARVQHLLFSLGCHFDLPSTVGGCLAPLCDSSPPRD